MPQGGNFFFWGPRGPGFFDKFVKKIALEKDLNIEQEKMLVKILLEMKLTLKNVKYENGEIIEITDFDKILEKIE